MDTPNSSKLCLPPIAKPPLRPGVPGSTGGPTMPSPALGRCLSSRQLHAFSHRLTVFVVKKTGMFRKEP